MGCFSIPKHDLSGTAIGLPTLTPQDPWTWLGRLVYGPNLGGSERLEGLLIHFHTYLALPMGALSRDLQVGQGSLLDTHWLLVFGRPCAKHCNPKHDLSGSGIGLPRNGQGWLKRVNGAAVLWQSHGAPSSQDACLTGRLWHDPRVADVWWLQKRSRRICDHVSLWDDCAAFAFA